MIRNKHEPEIRRLRRSGVTIDEAARRLGLKMSSMKTYCAEIGIRGWETDGGRARKARNDQISDMYAAARPLAEIAAAVGLSLATLKVTAHLLGCTRSPKEAALLRHARMREEAA